MKYVHGKENNCRSWSWHEYIPTYIRWMSRRMWCEDKVRLGTLILVVYPTHPSTFNLWHDAVAIPSTRPQSLSKCQFFCLCQPTPRRPSVPAASLCVKTAPTISARFFSFCVYIKAAPKAEQRACAPVSALKIPAAPFSAFLQKRGSPYLILQSPIHLSR